MMHGNIAVTSEYGKGSSFIFNIWTDIVSDKDKPSESKDKNVKEDETIDCKGMKFLLVEDNEINQEIALSVLGEFGATIDVANNGKEGLDMFLANPEKYDIIFMDIQMPIMDGFEATRQIRASDTKTSKTIPIVAMTAEVFQEDINNALNAGMNEHLGKPFKVSDLVAAIKSVLNSK